MDTSEPGLETLGHLLQAFAAEVNNFLRFSSPVVPEEVRRQVDVALGADRHAATVGVSKLADEITFMLLQTTGNLLHGLGTILMGRTPGSPPPVAALTRSIIEHSAMCVYACSEEDHLHRTVRAAILARRGLIEDGAKKPGAPFHEMKKVFDRLIQDFQRSHEGEPKAPPSQLESLVKQELSEVCSEDQYRLLHQYVHPSPVTAMMTSLNADLAPVALKVDTYDLSFLSAHAFYAAATAAIPTMSGDLSKADQAVRELSAFECAVTLWMNANGQPAQQI